MNFKTKGVFAFGLFAAATVVCGTASSAADSLQYDEIVRVVVGQATPPPPGSFKTDLAAINDASTGQAQAPPKKHGFGNLLGAVLSGQNPVDVAAGNVADNALSNAMGGMLGSLNSFSAFMRQGKVARYTFYNGWERVDDIAGQSATIDKFDRHQVIALDLQKKTYRITDTSEQASTETPAPAQHSKHEHPSDAPPEQPGTAVVDLRLENAVLGQQVLEGIPTTGYRSKVTLAMTQATGSCRNGSFSVANSQYFSKLQEPRIAYAATETSAQPAPRVPTDPQAIVRRGGCEPTFTMHSTGSPPPSGRFMMYSRMTMQPQDASSGNGSTFAFVTERGNVYSLPTSTAAPLFEVPPDFVPAK